MSHSVNWRLNSAESIVMCPFCILSVCSVVGGGNSAGQAVMHLAKHAKSVTMLVRDKALAASMSQYLSDRILGAANVQPKRELRADATKLLNRMHRTSAHELSSGPTIDP